MHFPESDTLRVRKQSSRSKLRRPDVIQVSKVMHDEQVRSQKPWSEVGPVLIQEFQNGSSNEDKRLSDLEAAIVNLYPTLSGDTKDITWCCKLQATVHASPLQDLVAFSLLQGHNIGLQTSRKNAFLSTARSSHILSMKHSVLTLRTRCHTTGSTTRYPPLVQTTVMWHVKR